MQGDRSGEQMSIDINLPRTLSMNSSGFPVPGPSTSMNKMQADHEAESMAADHSKKLQNEIDELACRIKDYEGNAKYLTASKKKLEDSISRLQVSLREYTKASSSKTKREDSNSAAALLSTLKHHVNAIASDHRFKKDVLGVVATLGMVADDNLSRLLSEYLGRETMLAVVCKTIEGVKALKTYDRDGSMDKTFGLHAFEASASTGRPLNDRLLVRCLENIRPYAGKFIAGDPQRRLNLIKPRMLNGETPRGFLGFAVNMITIDISNLNYILMDGRGLRETLFYSLFSNAQVYETKEDMLKAMPVIGSGAISLDGGIMRDKDVFLLGQRDRGDIEIKFPNVSERMINLPEKYFEIANQIKQTKWEKDRTIDRMRSEQSLLDRARFIYEMKKKEFALFVAQCSPQVS